MDYLNSTSDATSERGGLRGKLKKVVLAYSGGLDTSVIVPWLRENYGCEVVCFTADVGQGIKELEGLEEKAKASGACQLVVKDLKEEFVRDYIFPCLRAGAIYERKYLLGTSMARPVIAKAMVDVAKEVGADAVAHGCTGKGNDQVRFELTFFALDPKLNVVAPWREWDIRGREDAIEYAKKHNVPVPVTKKSIYSRDGNLWHLSHEGDILEDPANEPKKDMYMLTVDPEDAPNEPEYIEIGILSGLPVSINGKEVSPASLLSELNQIGGRHGIGRVDMVENRLVGMKSRGVYETPGGTILFTAVRELESLTLDRETMQVKDSLALKYAEQVYAGRWFDPLRESLDAFMENITKTTTGSVTLKLYKGSVSVTSRTSPFSLYRQDISSFESGEIYDQADAAGFIRLYGLPMKKTEQEKLGKLARKMARRRDKDVNWSPEAEEQLLRLLGEFNLLSLAGNAPNRDKYTQWATVLSSHFSIPVSWDKVKQKAGQLKRTFDAEFLLRNATGLGWDPIEKKSTCTEEYWQQFISSHPEVEKARKKPLADYNLYYCAFVNTCATGTHEYGQDEIPASPPHPPENLLGSPIDIDGGQSQFNEFGDTSFTEMREALHQTGQVPHLASQSRLISKRSSTNSHTHSPTFMERAMDRLVSSIEQKNCSRGKSSAMPNSVELETYEDKCIDLLGELEIPQDQYLFMFNFLTSHATLQRPFLRMKEHHRLVWIKQTMDSHANQQFHPVPPPPQMHAPPGHFQSNTPLNPQASHTFYPNLQPTSPTFQPYNPLNFSPFSGRHGGDGSSHPN